jgi:CheY-like chemotaxis protein
MTKSNFAARASKPDVNAGQNQEGEMQRRALVVDDEAATCELIQKVLYAAGVDALTLTSSGQAVAFLEEGKFDMVFFDCTWDRPTE